MRMAIGTDWWQCGINIEQFQPEKLLIVAVIERAVRDYFYPKKGNETRNLTQVRYEARGWLLSDSEEPFSFNWCCRQLDDMGDMLRERILNAYYTKNKSGDIKTYSTKRRVFK